MNAPPGRRSPGVTGSRATATSGLHTADEASGNPATDLGQDEVGALFEAVVNVHAYGTSTSFVVPEQDYRRGPAPRGTDGPQDADAPAWWWAEAERVVMDVVNAGGTVSADDLHECFPDEPSASGAAFGGLFSRLANEGRIVEVGMVKSRRPEARKRRIITWGRP